MVANRIWDKALRKKILRHDKYRTRSENKRKLRHLRELKSQREMQRRKQHALRLPAGSWEALMAELEEKRTQITRNKKLGKGYARVARGSSGFTDKENRSGMHRMSRDLKREARRFRGSREFPAVTKMDSTGASIMNPSNPLNPLNPLVNSLSCRSSFSCASLFSFHPRNLPETPSQGNSCQLVKFVDTSSPRSNNAS